MTQNITGRLFGEKNAVSFWDRLRLSRNIGIDLGASNVRAHVASLGVVVSEPCVVAVDKTTDRILAFGTEAQSLSGRTPQNMDVICPLHEGIVTDYEITLRILQYCIRAACGNTWLPPRLMICVPSGITDVEEQALVEAAKEAGAGSVYLMESILAAAMGAGLSIEEPVGRMIVDIGGGTADAAVLSMGGVVVSRSVRVAGDQLDEAIMRYVKNKFGLLIGTHTAELIKQRIGSLYPQKQVKSVEVRGRSAETGLPASVVLYSREMLEALSEPMAVIMDAVCTVIEETPPELLSDLLQGGIMLTGGCSLIPGMDQLISRVTGLPVHVAEDPINCAVRGTERALADYKNRQEGVLHLSRGKHSWTMQD